MLIETIVLNRDECVLKVFRNLINTDRPTILRRMNVGYLIAMNIVNLRRCRRNDILCQIRSGIQACREKSAANTDDHDKQYQPYGENCFSKNGAILGLLCRFLFAFLHRYLPVRIFLL